MKAINNVRTQSSNFKQCRQNFCSDADLRLSIYQSSDHRLDTVTLCDNVRVPPSSYTMAAMYLVLVESGFNV
jgi:hypothetical protein